MNVRHELRGVWVLMRRALNEVIRVPGAAIPGVLAPSIFMLGLTAVFGKLALLPGFTTDSFISFLIPISLLQAAGFSGAATGVNLARDIEQGWFDRLLVAPTARATLLAGTVLSATFRAIMPVSMALVVGFAFGVDFPGVDGLLLALAIVLAFATLIACWTTTLALRFKTQDAAPLMQASTFMAVLFTTSYAPQELLTGWLHDVAKYNPITQVVEAVRQGFVTGGISWHETWPALLTIAGLALVLVSLALRGLRRAGV